MQSRKSSKKFDIGILGGGQLARMMVLKAHELGISTLVFCESSQDPAAQVTSHVFLGKLNSASDIKRFYKKCARITFESEFFDADFLRKCSGPTKVKFFPKLKTLKCLQFRDTQKQSLLDSQIPTSPFVMMTPQMNYSDLCEKLKTNKFVIKKCIGGYDGYGTFVVKGENDFENFSQENELKQVPCIAEVFIPFQREVAITFGRRPSSQVVQFPFVESHQENSRCLWVKGPIHSSHMKKLSSKLKNYLQKIDYHGVIAFELFELKNGSLMVNEVAPRVHNSSHYSLNGFTIDQFSIHLLAGLNRTLPNPDALSKGFAMYNVLGSGFKSIQLKTSQAAQLHWYGKAENRKGRKMGHVNAQGATSSQALQKAKKSRGELKV